MNMNCCGNGYGLSQILTKEEDLSNKESILERRKELEQVQRNSIYGKTTDYEGKDK